MEMRLKRFVCESTSPLREFYDFAAKLTAHGSRRAVTADLFDGVKKAVQSAAMNTHQALR